MQRTVAQELVQRGSQRVGEGRERFDHEGGGVIGEQASVEPLMIESRRVAHHERSRNCESQQFAVAVSAEDLAIRDDDMRPDVVAGEAADTSQLAIGFVG